MILHVHGSYVTLTFLNTMKPLGVSPLSLPFLPPFPFSLLPCPLLVSFLLFPLFYSSFSPSSLYPPPSLPWSILSIFPLPPFHLFTHLLSPHSLPSSLFPFTSLLTVFSDFPEWQKVALSSPTPRETFVPPHLEPRVRVSASCWQHCSMQPPTLNYWCSMQPSIVGAPWAVTWDNTVPASLTA